MSFHDQTESAVFRESASAIRVCIYFYLHKNRSDRGGHASHQGGVGVRHVLGGYKKCGPSSCSLLLPSFLMQLRVSQFVRQFSTIMARPRVYFDMTIGGSPAGRILMEVCINLLEFEAV